MTYDNGGNNGHNNGYDGAYVYGMDGYAHGYAQGHVDRARGPPRRRVLQAAPGFSPETWGPSMWLMVHLIAATYPANPTQEDKERYAAFFHSLRDVLPCEGCRRGYDTILRTAPTQLTPQVFATTETLFKWTVDVHNRVNAKLGKPVNPNWRQWFRQYGSL